MRTRLCMCVEMCKDVCAGMCIDICADVYVIDDLVAVVNEASAITI